jgi:hypothetical protein
LAVWQLDFNDPAMHPKSNLRVREMLYSEYRAFGRYATTLCLDTESNAGWLLVQLAHHSSRTQRQTPLLAVRCHHAKLTATAHTRRSA